MKCIVIVLDSVARQVLRCYGAAQPAITPNVDRLAKRGVVFDNHWCGSAPGMPARRELLTGRLNFLEKPWGGVEPFDCMLPTLLSEFDISTRIVTDNYRYLQIGGENYLNAFQTYELIRGHGEDPWRDSLLSEEIPFQTVTPYDLHNWRAVYANRSVRVDERRYPTPITMQKAADWIHENRTAEDYFLWVEGLDPQEPFDVTQNYLDLYASEERVRENDKNDWPDAQNKRWTSLIERRTRVRYKALLSMADAYLGKILDILDCDRLWDDTMVIFTTDSGYLLGEHGYWTKNSMPAYNEVFRIPLIIAAPEAKPRRVAELTQSVDLFPTIAELFGVLEEARNPLHGKSLLPLLDGSDEPIHDSILYGYFGKSVNWTDGRYTYFRAADRLLNRPLGIYTAMPTMPERYYNAEVIDEDEMRTITLGHLMWTKYPVFRIPADIVEDDSDVIGVGHRSKENADSLLFDLWNDPEQMHPIRDAALERSCAEQLVRKLHAYDAPPEQYRRLGLST